MMMNDNEPTDSINTVFDWYRSELRKSHSDFTNLPPKIKHLVRGFIEKALDSSQTAQQNGDDDTKPEKPDKPYSW